MTSLCICLSPLDKRSLSSGLCLIHPVLSGAWTRWAQMFDWMGEHKWCSQWYWESKLSKSNVPWLSFYWGGHRSLESEDDIFKVRKNKMQEQAHFSKGCSVLLNSRLQYNAQILCPFKTCSLLISKDNKGSPNLYCWRDLPLQKYFGTFLRKVYAF